MNKQLTTSIRLQKDLHTRLLARVISDGYGMRGKSKWIIEAIERFVMLPHYQDFVDIADEALEASEVVTLRLSKELADMLEQAILYTRTKYPLMEGVKGKLVRASIIQRILRG